MVRATKLVDGAPAQGRLTRVQGRANGQHGYTTLVLVGAGGMARHHLRQILLQPDRTRVVALCDPSQAAYEAAAALFVEHGLPAPAHLPDVPALLAEKERLGGVDAAFIITPHALHHDQAVACLQGGLDVLLEKPMVLNAQEARGLIDVQQRTGRLLVVAFNGSLSPAVRHASNLLRGGEMGELLTISATVWQDWKQITTGTWRQEPAVSGGGFLFDTGAHMLNTVADLAGEDFVEVSARLDRRGAPVDIVGVVVARLASGALVTLHGCGEGAPTMGSDVRVFCTRGVIRTGVWGEFLEVQRPADDRLRRVRVARSLGAWDQFLRVRSGQMENPCPPEVGLRMVLLWDAIQESARRGGEVVQVERT